MAQLQFAGKSIETDEQGFLKNPQDWNKDVAEVIAGTLGMRLTERHWKVIDFCRADFAATSQSPGLRRITKVGGVPTKDLYELFPGGPGKLSAKIAGLAKPTGCV